MKKKTQQRRSTRKPKTTLRAAGMLARRISYNEILFTLMALEKEYLEKPMMERP